MLVANVNAGPAGSNCSFSWLQVCEARSKEINVTTLGLVRHDHIRPAMVRHYLIAPSVMMCTAMAQSHLGADRSPHFLRQQTMTSIFRSIDRPSKLSTLDDSHPLDSQIFDQSRRRRHTTLIPWHFQQYQQHIAPADLISPANRCIPRRS